MYLWQSVTMSQALLHNYQACLCDKHKACNHEMKKYTSMRMAFPIFQNSIMQPIPELASIIQEVSLSRR